MRYATSDPVHVEWAYFCLVHVFAVLNLYRKPANATTYSWDKNERRVFVMSEFLILCMFEGSTRRHVTQVLSLISRLTHSFEAII